MSPREFLQSRPVETVESMCVNAGTNLAYFKQIASGHRRPSVELAERLAAHSGGHLDVMTLLLAKRHARMLATANGAGEAA